MVDKPTCETCRAFTRNEEFITVEAAGCPAMVVSDGDTGVCRVFPTEVNKHKNEHCFQYVNICTHEFINVSHTYMGYDHRCAHCGMQEPDGKY